ncbi:DUF3486 family protein [Sphingomonas sp.]|uniref:DUF3486 family protein n=1 Tax=Sphingomonas sp. TaxID=28214 RepID=UPI00307F020E
MAGAEQVQGRREGRGRLSTLDMLPEEAEPDIAWALDALNERAMPQKAILDEFNARLADRGIGKVSKSAFNRWSIRKAIQFRRLNEVRTITGEIVRDLGAEGVDNVTIAVAESIKAAVYERLEGDNDPKALMALGRALNSAVAAQKSSAELRSKIEARTNAQLEAAAEKVETVGREAGLSEDRIAQIRRDVLGLKVA